MKRQTVVTCIATLKKSHDEEKAVSCLILGSESSMIYVLDPEAFTILDSMVVPAPPAHLAVTGLYDVDYRFISILTLRMLATFKYTLTLSKSFQEVKLSLIYRFSC